MVIGELRLTGGTLTSLESREGGRKLGLFHAATENSTFYMCLAKHYRKLLMKNEMTHWVKLVAWNIVPVTLVHLIARMVWTNGSTVDQTGITVFEAFVTMVIAPVYLLAVNFRLNDRMGVRTTIVVWHITVLTLALSTFLHFKNWADTVGSWTHPDSGTIAVVLWDFVGGAILVTLVLGFSLIKSVLK